MCYAYSMFFLILNATATTAYYTLSLHDALPIFRPHASTRGPWGSGTRPTRCRLGASRRCTAPAASSAWAKRPGPYRSADEAVPLGNGWDRRAGARGPPERGAGVWGGGACGPGRRESRARGPAGRRGAGGPRGGRRRP